MPKVKKNVDVLEAQTNNLNDKAHAVLSSLVIAYIFTKYNVKLNHRQYKFLLKCLRLPPEEEVCSDIMKNINEFSSDRLR